MLSQYNLRKINYDDLPMLLKWRNSDYVRCNMVNQKIISNKEHYSWYKKLKKDNTVDYLIFEKENKPLGVVNFNECRIISINKKFYWGFYIGIPDAPKGIGTILGYFALEYVFNKKGALIVMGEVLESNLISLNFHNKMGFNEMLRKDKKVKFILKKEKWDSHKGVILNNIYKNAVTKG